MNSPQHSANENSPQNRNIILFDGVCNFCNFWVDFIIKRDKKKIFKFAALQTNSGNKILDNFREKTEGVDSVIFVENNRCFTRSSAALRIVKKLPGLWAYLYAFIIIPKPLRDFIYDFVAKNRYRIFGQKESCRLPSPEEKDRFI